MKITVIGHWGAFPCAGEATSSYLLEVGPHKILLDCGSGALAGLQKHIGLHELTAVIISHHHFDHMGDLGCLQYACLIETDLKLRERPLRVLIPKDADWTLPTMKGTTIEKVTEHGPVTFEGDLQFTFFQTSHGVYCLGVRVEAEGHVLAYTADTRYDESLVRYLKDADLLITECSFYAGTNAGQYGHMNSHEAGKLAAAAGVKKLVLSHLPHFGELPLLKEEAGTLYSGEIVLAEMGLKFEL